MALLKQSTVYTRVFLMVQSSDHVSGIAGATVAVSLSKAGGAFAAAGGTVSEIGNGFYKIALTAADTNTLGDLAFHATATGADPTDFIDQVAANILGDALPANVVQWNGGAVAAPASAGIPDVNVKNWNNHAALSDGNNLPKVDLEDIAGSAVDTGAAQLGVTVVGYAAGEDPGTLVLDAADGLEAGVTVRQGLRYSAAALAGVLAGAATTNVTIAGIGNASTPRISATVDGNGNRSSVTLS